MPTLIKVLDERKDHRELGEYKCECGKTFVSTTYNIRVGRQNYCRSSCELARSRAAEKRTKHGKSHSLEYEAFRSMHKRCYQKSHPAYERYRANGITVCDKWRNFENFYKDMGDKPTPQHTLDRIDNSKGYSPGNCRWATMKQQQRNKANTLWVTVDGVKMRLTEYAEQLGMTYSTAYMRLWRNKLQGVKRYE